MDREQAVKIAWAVHYANIGWNIGLDDPAPDPGFYVLPAWQREFIIDRVRLIEHNLPILDDEDLAVFIHQVWVDLMTSPEHGWRLGSQKDPVAKTHPCLQDFRELPPEQQKKDYMAIAIVRALL